jgi:hypothetical protein
MLHLKLFNESFNNEELYKEITPSEWGFLYRLKTTITNEEFNQIKEMVKPLITPYPIKGYKPLKPSIDKCIDGRISKKKEVNSIYMMTILQNSTHIWKLEDDWWVVNLPYNGIWHDRERCFREYGEEHPWVYYKCDQLDGLKEFFDNKILELLDSKTHKDDKSKDPRLWSDRKKYPHLNWPK